jgi:hypothetical protein
MREAEPRDLEIDRHLRPQPECADPDYLVWRDRKVRSALAEANDPRIKLIAHEDMRKLFEL